MYETRQGTGARYKTRQGTEARYETRQGTEARYEQAVMTPYATDVAACRCV